MNYDIKKIKYSIDDGTFDRAVDLYESGKVTKFVVEFGNYSALVLGGQPYKVSVSVRDYTNANCECYVGQKWQLCKHMVAVAIYAVQDGEKLTAEDKTHFVSEPSCTGELKELDKDELDKVKKDISLAMKYIKSYNGPSRTWFAYQDSLSEGCVRLSEIISKLPASKGVAKLLVDMLLRLDKKLCTGGTDDSDGTVGSLMYGVVEVLKEFAMLDKRCIEVFAKICQQETCFEWGDDLVSMVDEGYSE